MLIVSMREIEAAVTTRLQGITVAYGSPLGTQTLRIYFEGEANPEGATVPWGRLVSVIEGDLTGGRGLANDGSMVPITVTVNLTSPDTVTQQSNRFLPMAIDAVSARLSDDISRVPVAGQTQWLRFVGLQRGVDPNPDDSIFERTGYVVASALVTRNIN